MSSAEAKNLEVISKAIDQHNNSCEWPAVAVEMNSFEVERLGWDSIRGLPIRPNAEMGTGAFRVVCAREEGEPEEIVEAAAQHAVSVHGHEDSQELRDQTRELLEPEDSYTPGEREKEPLPGS